MKEKDFIEFFPVASQVTDGKFKTLLEARTTSNQVQVRGRIEIVGLAKDQQEIMNALSKKIIKLT